MMDSVPTQDQWHQLIGFGTPPLLTHNERNYRVKQKNIGMNDEGDMIMAFDVCMEAEPGVN